VLFFKEFSGFNYDEDEAHAFTKKNKKKYEEITAKALKALDDPHFNMWTWQRNLSSLKTLPSLQNAP